jgi:glycosyltransferase involved in cell wall biosynthesis
VKIACIMTVFPSVSETFVFGDVRALQDAGHEVGILHFIDGPRDIWQEDAAALRERVLRGGPLLSLGVLGAVLRMFLRRPLRLAGTLLWVALRSRSTLRGRLKTLAILPKCVQFAADCRRFGADHVHATWANHAAVAALVVRRLAGIPYSMSAHAGQDVFRDPVMLPEKVREARFVAVCNGIALERLRAVSGEAGRERLHFVSHGVDVSRFPFRPPDDAGLEASREAPRILFVGRLLEGKGLPTLLRAAELLRDEDRAFRLDVLGDGPDREDTASRVARAGLGDRVTLHGAVPQTVVGEHLAQATLLALPMEVRADGGRDGLPNVILEAMASGVPVVASRSSAIGDAVEDGESGLLVPPRDPEALARAIGRLLDDPALAARLSRAARRVVDERFDRRRCSRRFVELFDERGGDRGAATR